MVDTSCYGAGFGTREFIKYLADWRNTRAGASNSIMMILGYGGI